MKRADYHIHSQFSPDATLTIDKACEKAIQLGIDELCFTDHLEFAENHLVNYDNYRDAIEAAKAKYEKVLSIKIGMEVGFDKWKQQQIKDYLENKEFDFLIGSMHRINGLNLFNGDFFAGKKLDFAFGEYFEALYEAVLDFDFSVLGHITLIKRFFRRFNVNPSDFVWIKYDDIIKAVLQKLITHGKGIELNLRVPLIDLDFRILKFYKELGGEIITLGTDSHHEQNMHTPEEGIQALRDVGLRYYSIFEKRKPLFIPIK
ncbi:histidinol-phosphatase [Desulfosporosinus acididurans]|uniref:Histidinol-phosphatase n=1 Tax=Desulfosporosinus acididurans TaxID=476652 RepID=A0A0J1FSL2_9FIRM|nr:histidinol-phosphatase HisJ family protein [Desulfosporosinus acididurans]KLU65963.1 histidinol-phosphatase [Desulfosporosinus acididurans]